MGAEALIIGTGISAFASISSGMSKKEAYEMEAAAKQSQAAQVDLSAGREIELTQRKYERTKAAQIASFGKSGVTLSGSPLMFLEESAAEAFDEIRSIQDAASYRKSTLQSEAMMSRSLGEDAELAGYLSGAGSILTGFAKNPYTYDRKEQYITLGPKEK